MSKIARLELDQFPPIWAIVAGDYEREHTKMQQRFYLVQTLDGQNLVCYENFAGFLTPPHGYWRIKRRTGTLIVWFHHWGPGHTTRLRLAVAERDEADSFKGSTLPARPTLTQICNHWGRDFLLAVIKK